VSDPGCHGPTARFPWTAAAGLCNSQEWSTTFHEGVAWAGAGAGAARDAGLARGWRRRRRGRRRRGHEAAARLCLHRTRHAQARPRCARRRAVRATQARVRGRSDSGSPLSLSGAASESKARSWRHCRDGAPLAALCMQTGHGQHGAAPGPQVAGLPGTACVQACGRQGARQPKQAIVKRARRAGRWWSGCRCRACGGCSSWTPPRGAWRVSSASPTWRPSCLTSCDPPAAAPQPARAGRRARGRAAPCVDCMNCSAL